MVVLGYLTKTKRGLGLAFGAYYLQDFSIKMFLIPYLIFYQLTTFQCQTFFPSQDIKKNVLLNYLDNR